jgi:hypothetical protein
MTRVYAVEGITTVSIFLKKPRPDSVTNEMRKDENKIIIRYTSVLLYPGR